MTMKDRRLTPEEMHPDRNYIEVGVLEEAIAPFKNLEAPVGWRDRVGNSMSLLINLVYSSRRCWFGTNLLRAQFVTEDGGKTAYIDINGDDRRRYRIAVFDIGEER